jgi:hypothetical protein
MDAFEAARLKHAKNKERFARSAASKVVEAAQAAPEPVVVETPKEKAISKDGFIQVVVTLPTGEFSMTFRKRNVMENVSRSQMNKVQIQNAIAKGLEPLMGRVEAL